MTSGLYAAVSGIKNNQARLNIIANNIANMNSVAFKSSDATFAAMYAQTLNPGSSPGSTVGGTNPQQVGMGAQLQNINVNMAQGGNQITGRNTDMMINGGGFFVVNTPGDVSFTRVGAFSLDGEGNLVTGAGNYLRGTSQVSGSSAATVSDRVTIPQTMVITKDLSAAGATVGSHFAAVGVPGASITAAITAGATSQVTEQVTLTGFTVSSSGGVTATYSNGDRVSIRTNPATETTNPATARTEIIHMTAEGDILSPGLVGATPSVATDAGLVGQITGYEVFKAPAGGNALEGMQMNLQMAAVTNPNGMIYNGSGLYTAGQNAGTIAYGTAASDSRGSIQVGSLETSNVDLSTEFSNMVIAQRGLEASSKIIRTISESLQRIVDSV